MERVPDTGVSLASNDRYVTENAGYFTPLLDILPELPEAEVIVDVGAGTGAATVACSTLPRARSLRSSCRRRCYPGYPTGGTGHRDVSFADCLGSVDLVVGHNAPFAPDELYRHRSAPVAHRRAVLSRPIQAGCRARE